MKRTPEYSSNSSNRRGRLALLGAFGAAAVTGALWLSSGDVDASGESPYQQQADEIAKTLSAEQTVHGVTIMENGVLILESNNAGPVKGVVRPVKLAEDTYAYFEAVPAMSGGVETGSETTEVEAHVVETDEAVVSFSDPRISPGADGELTVKEKIVDLTPKLSAEFTSDGGVYNDLQILVDVPEDQKYNVIGGPQAGEVIQFQ